MRTIALFGEVEPKLKENCDAVLRKVAKEQLDAALVSLKQVKPPLDCKNAALNRAIGQLLFAIRQFFFVVADDHGETKPAYDYLAELARRLDPSAPEAYCLRYFYEEPK
jgi:hypothetical protein